MPKLNPNSYYIRQSETSKVSKKFVDKFGNTPDEIIKQVRKKMIHPCELPHNFDHTNWPRLQTAKDIEWEMTNQRFAFGVCRAFTLICVAIMRAKGIPARSRCGFATYFVPGIYEDHWIMEYMQDNKWRLADAQKLKMLVKPGEFINGAVAWQMVRKFGFDPKLLGFSGQKDMASFGIEYIIKNMIRDVSGLIKQELNYNNTVKLDKKLYNLSKKDYDEFDKISDMILKEDIDSLQKLDMSGLI